jgi:zinc D-Ala-D-Ala dipeptidase
MPAILTRMRPVARRRGVSTLSMLIRAGLVLTLLLPAPALAGSGLPKASLPKGSLPKGFVYLRDIDPTIVQDIRYAGSHNFVGRPIRGYLAAECILSERAAKALETVQRILAEKRLSLIVWDCYRPKRAVDDFHQWSKDPAHSEMKAEFYPRTDKAKLLALGYLATRSAHSRGSTVDLGIVPTDFSLAPPPNPPQPLKACTSPKGERFEDGTIDFRHGLRLSGRAWKYIKRCCRRDSTPQPSNPEILHAGGRLSSLCQGVVALRTYQCAI